MPKPSKRSRKRPARKIAGRGREFDWVPASREDEPETPPTDQNEWSPLDRWMEQNGGFPEGKLVLFDNNGRTIKLDDIRCGRTYFSTFWQTAAVPACPAAAALRQLTFMVWLIALMGAGLIQERCRRRPSCQSTIRVQVEVSRCYPVGKKAEIKAGYCFRIDCFTL